MGWKFDKIISFFRRRRKTAGPEAEAAEIVGQDKGGSPAAAPEKIEPEKPVAPAPKRRSAPRPRSARRSLKKSRPSSRNRHGMPILTERDDLFRLFTGQNGKDFRVDTDFAAAAEDIRLAEIRAARRQRAEYRRPSPGPKIDVLKEYPDPQAEIDLHRLTSREAAMKTEFFIKAASQQGLRTVRIITGKGLHSEGRPVLPEAVQGKIVELKKNKVVLTFAWEKQGKLKSGALLVYLQTPAAGRSAR